MIKTNLPAPRCQTQAQIKTAQKFWWSPLDEILSLVDKDIGQACALVDKSLARLAGLTISDPSSIIRTAKAVYSENGRASTNGTLADQGYSRA